MKHCPCESDAVFRPSPNRPRSFAFRVADGPIELSRIASTKRASDIPVPSSTNAMCGFFEVESRVTTMLLASAVMLLSTRSAIAVESV